MNIARISTNGVDQTVTLPQEFHLLGTEVYIKKIGGAIVLIAKEHPWQSLFESLSQFSEDFMEIREQPAIDVREDF